MLEYSPLGQGGEPSAFGGREDYWTLCFDVAFPWTIFDMTNRIQKPTAEAPSVVARRYAPGGTDGAVFVSEWQSAYATNFGGVVRYDMILDPLAVDGAGQPAPLAICQPNYESYAPAVLLLPGAPGDPLYPVEKSTEQLTLVELTPSDRRLVAPTGKGRAFEWKLDPTTHNPISNQSTPAGGRLIPPFPGWIGAETDAEVLDELWGVNLSAYSNAYSLYATAGRGVQTDRAYVLLDLALTPTQTTATKLMLGRYWFEVEDPLAPGQAPLEEGYWQTIDLSAFAAVTANIHGIAVNESGDFAAIACGKGVYVLRLHGAGSGFPPDDPAFASDIDWAVTDVLYVGSGSGGTSEYTVHDGFGKVEAVAWLGNDFLVMSLSNNKQFTCTGGGQGSSSSEALAGGIAIYKFGHHSGLLEQEVFFAEDYQGYEPTAGQGCPAAEAAIDGIPETQFFTGGAVGAFEISEGVYRIYCGSSYSGAVLEYEFVHSEASTTTLVGYFVDETHKVQVSSCLAYSIGLPSGIPIVLVGRFLQTIAVLAGADALGLPQGE